MSSSKRRSQGAPAPAGTRTDPLAATPEPAPGVDAKRDDAGMLQVRRMLPTRGRVGELLERLFGHTRYVRVKLDERGSWFWEQIDGTRDLHGIEESLRKRYSLSREESTKAVIEFVKALMVRGLICLRLHEERTRIEA